MKRFHVLGITLFVTIIGNFLFSSENVSAYYKDNCFAVQYMVEGALSGGQYSGTTTGWHSTDVICLKDGKLVANSPSTASNIKKGQAVFPIAALKVSEDGKSVTVSSGKKEQTFTLSGDDVKKLGQDVYNYMKKEKIGPSNGKIVDYENNDEKSNSEFYTDINNSGCKGASALGWIICPIIETASKAADQIYTEFVAPALQVEPQLFASDGKSSGVRGAWDTFRNFANIIFVILLLFVIFSQVTGVGIDNYGIKKILPKLIVAAVLINLSYILCILAVDISNIIGNAFQSLFTTLGEQLKPVVADGSEEGVSLAVTGGTLVGLGAFGAIAGSSITVWGPAVMLSLLMGAISLITSIFFLLILLAAREAAIIVLVVLAPVAVVLYALPNTKTYFDKWLKFFGSLLMVYPIAGLLVGGGNYIAALLLSTDMSKSFFSALTAMIAGVIPIFFIPTVLKGSLSMAGNIGNKISSFGKATGARFSRAGGGALQNNERFANWQNDMARQAKLNSAARTERRLNRKQRGGLIIPGRELSMADNRALARSAMITKSAKMEDIQSYEALINSETDNGANEEALFALADKYAAAGNTEASLAVANIAGRRKDTANNYMKHVFGGVPEKDNNGNIVKDENGNVKMRGNNPSFNSAMLQSISKQITEGDNSANFRAASAFRFEYAGDLTKGTISPGEEQYVDWRKNGENLGNAIEHHVTDAGQLMGQQKDSMTEIADAMQDGRLSDEYTTKMQTLAQERIANRDTVPGYDVSKEAEMTRLAAGRGGSSGGQSNSSNSMSVPHGNTPTNIGGAGGADSVSE